MINSESKMKAALMVWLELHLLSIKFLCQLYHRLS